jgi:peptidoglycan-associated lipoprotein
VIAKQGLKLLGLFLLVAMVAASGCRKKTQPSVGRETLDTTVIDEQPPYGEEVTDADPRLSNEYGTPVDVKLDPVLFKFDSAKLDDSELAKADKVAALANENPSYKVVIEGNCDERGTAEYNMALGERRAQAVRAYLLNVGVPEDRVQTLSYGEEKPLSPGHSESDWSQNRRAEFAIYE